MIRYLLIYDYLSKLILSFSLTLHPFFDVRFSAANYAHAHAIQWADAETFPITSVHESFLPESLLPKPRDLPRNPFGRTGLEGRGSLGKWGELQFKLTLFFFLVVSTSYLSPSFTVTRDRNTYRIYRQYLLELSYV